MCLPRLYNRLSFLPFTIENLERPATPSFSFNSSRAVVDVYKNQIFIFARSPKTGFVQRNEHLSIQVQGLQVGKTLRSTNSPYIIFEEYVTEYAPLAVSLIPAFFPVTHLTV